MNSFSKYISPKAQPFLLLILPLFLLYLGFLLKSAICPYYLSSVDPEYAYLFNGLNIAHFNFPYHIDHPGTPLQLISALIMRLVHFFRPETLDEDVFTNPELYIYSINTFIIFLHAIVLYIVGYKTFKATGKLVPALFLQLAPFLSGTVLEIQNRIMVEQLFISLLLIISLYIIKYLNDNEKKDYVFDKYLIVFSILIGIGVSIKLTFLPVAAIPFFMFEGFKKRAVFVFACFLSIAIFLWPVYNRWVAFRNWIEALFIHSGQYGSGPANFFDKNSLVENLKIIFSYESIFPKIFALTGLFLIVYQLQFLKLKRPKDVHYRLLFGIFITSCALVFMVAKQFKYFYLTPVLMLMAISIILILNISLRNIKEKIGVIITSILFLTVLYSAFKNEVGYIISNYKWGEKHRIELQKSQKIIEEKFGNEPTLLLARYEGAPFKENALFFGTAWVDGDNREKYNQIIAKIYPNTYIYHGWNNLFNGWGNNLNFIELLKKYTTVNLYVGDENLYTSLGSKLRGINRQIDCKIELIYSDEDSNDKVYKVKFSQEKSINSFSVTCNAEQLDSAGTNFITSDSLFFANGQTRSNEYALSGKYSSKLTPNNPYGFTCALSEVSKGEKYKISVWRFSNGNSNAGLVVTGKEPNLYYSFKTESSIAKNMWQKIEYEFVVPDTLEMKDMLIYTLNNDASLPAYFDDLTIEKIKGE